MSTTIDAAIIASAATLIGTLGTQLLNNRREDARRQAEVKTARIDEIRELFEEAAITIHDALDRLDHSRTNPSWATVPPASRELSEAVSKLEVIDTRLDTRVPALDQLASRWHRAFASFRRATEALRSSVRIAQDIAANGDDLAEQMQRFGRSVDSLQTKLNVFTDSAAWSFGARPEYHWTLRERLSDRWEKLKPERWRKSND